MYDVIICAGQSNMEGCGYGETERPFEPDPRILMMTCRAHMILPAAEEMQELPAAYRALLLRRALPRGHLGLSFAREYAQRGYLGEGRKILLLKAAVSATGFGSNHWKPQDVLYMNLLSMIQKALSLDQGARVTALLWHQGETDAQLQTAREDYERHLAGLVAGVRAACGEPDLPFLAGGFVPQWRQANKQTCTPILSALRTVTANTARAAFVESDGLPSNKQGFHRLHNDTIHFCRNALYQFGARYFEAWQGILDGATR
ncbi:MAG: sialate O-acetylesterase [Oscillospiraceae bacterium]|jgi:hypothetical protein|nr:sialate O-acetylesterase [Oscillospiraceae bacterium]